LNINISTVNPILNFTYNPISYVDTMGNAHNSFVMPQQDPTFYDTYIKNYNMPELIDGPVTVSHWKLLQVAHKVPMQIEFDSKVNIGALSGATKIIRTLLK